MENVRSCSLPEYGSFRGGGGSKVSGSRGVLNAADYGCRSGAGARSSRCAPGVVPWRARDSDGECRSSRPGRGVRSAKPSRPALMPTGRLAQPAQPRTESVRRYKAFPAMCNRFQMQHNLTCGSATSCPRAGEQPSARPQCSDLCGPSGYTIRTEFSTSGEGRYLILAIGRYGRRRRCMSFDDDFVFPLDHR